MEFWGKFKRFSLPDPSLPILGFFSATLLFTACFFYSDRAATALPRRSGGVWWRRVDGSSSSPTTHITTTNTTVRPEFLGGAGDGCDVFDGNWVWDQNYPLYNSTDCLFLDGGFRCSENGRPDGFFTKWRWQPKDCNLPRFDARKMLEKLQNRRVVFVGDSIGRNQWESFLCMLSSAVANKTKIYEVDGKPITKHMGFLVYKFEDFNCTVEYYRAPFIILQSRPPAGSPKDAKATLKLDQLDWTSDRWKDADVLIFNTGHWWNTEKITRAGCYFQVGAEVITGMSIESAFRKSIETILHWVDAKVNPSKTQVFFRTYSPVHFSGGDWRKGGRCHMETLPEFGPLPTSPDTHFDIVLDVLSQHQNESRATKLELLNVTYMSARRKDGHASLYYLGAESGPVPLHRQDCSHWCLPGVPDSWNELLYALFLKREYWNSANSNSSQVLLTGNRKSV